MRVFFSEAAKKDNVSSESPVDMSLEEALIVFRALDNRRGFMGILLHEPYVLQLMPSKNVTRIELLNSAGASIESCDAEAGIAEELIKAASKGEDVIKVARNLISNWEYVEL